MRMRRNEKTLETEGWRSKTDGFVYGLNVSSKCTRSSDEVKVRWEGGTTKELAKEESYAGSLGADEEKPSTQAN